MLQGYPSHLDAKCYVLRNPDLLEGFCNNEVANCRWDALRLHWEEHGREEGRAWGCSSAECYVHRNPDLLRGFCNNVVAECKWDAIRIHWEEHGREEARSWGCSPDSAPSESSAIDLSSAETSQLSTGWVNQVKYAMTCRPCSHLHSHPPPTLHSINTQKTAYKGIYYNSPPQGWRSWNCFQGEVTQEKMEQVMDAAVRLRPGLDGAPTSLRQLGFDNYGLDDNWQDCIDQNYHDEQGRPRINQRRFPDMKGMVAYGHRLGLRVGW